MGLRIESVAISLLLSVFTVKAACHPNKHIPTKEVENACGLLCFSLCCKLLNVSVDTETILQKYPPSKEGTNLLTLKDLADEYGLCSVAIYGTGTDLLRYASRSTPAIIRSGLAEHFYVTTGFWMETSLVELFDPSVFGRKLISIEELNRLSRGEALILSKEHLKLRNRNSYSFKFVILVFIFFSIITLYYIIRCCRKS